jgi:very-short-patch-repair endonuclease
MSLPEVLLWKALRHRPGGLKFRRQHPAGHFILDFNCSEARLAIEVDGAVHDGRLRQDSARHRYFEAAGIRTLRIPAAAILRNVEDAVRTILEVATGRRPLHQPAAGPPPRAGEDL